MSWFKSLFGRKDSHEDWLKKHPGKESSKTPPPAISEEDAQGMRDRMEAEMTADRAKRDS